MGKPRVQPWVDCVKVPQWPGGGARGGDLTPWNGYMGVVRLDMKVCLTIVKFRVMRLIDWKLVALIWLLVKRKTWATFSATEWATYK